MKHPKSVLILGRQPGLSLAELESLLGSENVLPFGGHCLSLVAAEEIPFSRLGGTLKTARLLAELPSPKWQHIAEYLLEKVPSHTTHLPGGKFTLGISVYGLSIGTSQINPLTLKLKKSIKEQGRPVRVVPNKEATLNTAQVLHNKLTHRGAWELIIISDGQKAYLAQTLFVQDIGAYAARDQERPKRDSLVGMLPPKLGQIIINLAVGKTKPDKNTAVYDPFCGTGVILQEALLMGFSALGSDNNPRMLEYTKDNLAWLAAGRRNYEGTFNLSRLDATHDKLLSADFVASEIYLGPPLKGRATPEAIDRAALEVGAVLDDFLKNARASTYKNICLAVPCWQLGDQFKHLPLLDRLSDLGYNRLSFVHAGAKEMIYHRPGQAVGREIIVLKKR